MYLDPRLGTRVDHEKSIEVMELISVIGIDIIAGYRHSLQRLWMVLPRLLAEPLSVKHGPQRWTGKRWVVYANLGWFRAKVRTSSTPYTT